METENKVIVAKDWLEGVSSYIRNQDTQELSWAFLCINQGWLTPAGEITAEGKKWIEKRGDIEASCLNSPELIVGD